MEIKKPELLAPAGDLERLRMAVLYGADAVYLAGTDFGMRAFAGNFSPKGLAEAVAFAHAHGVRVHCTVNTMPRNEEMDRLPAHLERLEAAGLRLDLAKGQVWAGERQAELTRNELQILAHLLRHAGEIVSRADLIEALWDSQIYIDDNTLSVNVTRLRAKLDSIGCPGCIKTRRGMGYQL